MIGHARVTIEVNRKAFSRAAHFNDFHAATDFATHCFIGNTVARKDIALSFCRSSSVAAHRGNDKRNSAERLAVLDRMSRDSCDVGNATTASGDSYRLPRLNALS